MLSTDTTWEVVQSFLNVPGMKGVALIDGRSRPYFQGIERVLNSQQREALAKGVWQVLETIPNDFESFEFQFAGTQVYIHKLSQEQILLVLTHDNLIYPDYFDAFSRLRSAFTQDSSATMEVFQRLLGARNTKVTPLNLSDLANADSANGDSTSGDSANGDSASKGQNEPVDRAALSSPNGTSKERSSEAAVEAVQAQGPPTLELQAPENLTSENLTSENRLPEIQTPEIPSGSADYAVAADTEITDVSTAAVEPDAPANPAQPERSEPAVTMPLEAEGASEDFTLDAPSLSDSPLPELAATDAGLPDLDGEVDEADGGLPELSDVEAVGDDSVTGAGLTGAAPRAENAADLFAASLTDANALVGRSAKDSDTAEPESVGAAAIELPALGDDSGSASLPEEDELLAVTPAASRKSPSKQQSSSSSRSTARDQDDQADLAALMDTLSLGEEDFETQGGTGSLPLQAAPPEAAPSENEATLPDLGAAAVEAIADGAGLPQIETDDKAAQALDPWDEPEAATAALSQALNEALEEDKKQPKPKPSQDEQSLLSVTPSALENSLAEQTDNATAAQQESLLNNRLDAVALDDDIEIDDLFGYEDSASKQPAAEAETAQAAQALLESYVESLNALGEFSAHYLGRAVIVNYWRTSRPGDEWLKGAFAIERAANSIRLGPDYAASRRSPVTDGQAAVLQTWAEQFVQRCSKVIRDFPQLAQQSLSEEQSKMLDL